MEGVGTVVGMEHRVGAVIASVLAVGCAVAVSVVGVSAITSAEETARPARTDEPVTSTVPVPVPATDPPPPQTQPPCIADPSLAQPRVVAPPDLAGALAAFLADPRIAPHAVGVSVWIDGYGEVLEHNADLPLAPASNEKLFTAMSALAVLGGDARLTTQVRLTDVGNLVVVGGGDATVTAAGPHSLAALAAQIHAGGVTAVSGALLVDESHHDGARRASGWQDWQIPTYTGPLSALMVDDNRWRGDAAYLADPAIGNADRLRDSLAAIGVTIAGPTRYADPAEAIGRPVASLASPTIAELARTLLTTSDNQIADLMMKNVGRAANGVGSMEAGATAGTAALASLCVPLTGTADDGSGLSRADQRSTREWRTLLQAARGASWFHVVHDGLPVAGRTGTLAGRFRGTAAEGNVRAKTGTIIGGSALSGYGTTLLGRPFVFSVVVNGPGTERSAPAIDAFITALAAHPA